MLKPLYSVAIPRHVKSPEKNTLASEVIILLVDSSLDVLEQMFFFYQEPYSEDTSYRAYAERARNAARTALIAQGRISSSSKEQTH